MSDLIGLLPAAGKGVRAYPHTATIPKAMLEVDGKPNLQRNVELMRDQLGIADIRIVVGYHGDVIRRHFGDGAGFGVRITYVENPRVDLELPYSIHLAGRDIASRCCLILADECYIGSNHAALLGGAPSEALVVCGVTLGESAKQIRKNYTVAVQDTRVVDLVEKPVRVSGPLMGTGTYLLQPEVFRRLEQAYRSGPEAGPRDWTSWLAGLARGGAHIAAFHLTGKYVNINSRDDLNTANYLLRDFHFAERSTSFVCVVDGDEEAAARVAARFAAEPEVDEVVVVARRSTAAFDALAAAGTVRLLIPEAARDSVAAMVKLGLESARGDMLLLSNGDDTFAARDVLKFLVYLRDADMVVGTRTTRQMIEQGTNMRGVVRLAHVLLAKLLQVLWWRFECRFTDLGCVFRAMWRSTYMGIRDQLTAPGIEIFPEMMIEVLRARGRIVEIPINYFNRDLERLQVWGPNQTLAVFARVVALLLRRRWADSALEAWWSGRDRA